MSGLCKDCKWWTSTGYDGWGECALTVTEGWYDPFYPESKARGLGTGSGSSASLLTTAGFGCNQFGARHIRGEE